MKTKLSPTEQINKNTTGLDRLDLDKMVDLMYQESLWAAKCVASAKKEIAKAVRLVEKAYKSGNKTIFMGAGTSGRLGILEAVECPPTFSVDYNAFTGIIAGGNTAIHKSVEGAEDSAEQGAKDFLKAAKKGDVLIGIAASGNTPYVQGALKAAKEKKYPTVLVACNDGANTKYADIFIYLPTGAEVVSGSTRLKAGTATKLALNMITTLAMVRCGKVYNNYMVDVNATNNKLRERAVRLVKIITCAAQEEAEKITKQAKYNVKAAVVMIKKNTDYKKALALLKKHKGFLRKIIG